MPMIKCPECGKEISDLASSCPNCGFPFGENYKKEKDKVETESKLKQYSLGIISLAVFVLGFFSGYRGIVIYILSAMISLADFFRGNSKKILSITIFIASIIMFIMWCIVISTLR